MALSTAGDHPRHSERQKETEAAALRSKKWSVSALPLFGVLIVKLHSWYSCSECTGTASLMERGQGDSLALLSCLSPVEEWAPSLQAWLVDGIHYQGHVFLGELGPHGVVALPVSLDSSGSTSLPVSRAAGVDFPVHVRTLLEARAS